MSLECEYLKKHLKYNLDWFENSGVIDPPDGRWGVAERVVLKQENKALSSILEHFPQYTEHKDHIIIEQRRADCNFQVAWLYWLASKVFQQSQYRDVCLNHLHFLYSRSGMRNLSDAVLPLGVWRWSSMEWEPTYWLDDNAWCCVITLALSSDTNLAEQFPLRESGLQIAEAMVDNLDQTLKSTSKKQTTFWKGDPASPHWGALMLMAFGYAYSFSKDPKFRQASETTLTFLNKNSEKFTVSEQAYMALGTSIASACFQDATILSQARHWADILIEKMETNGNLPSQWWETPGGEHLVDTIYTQNWVTLAFMNLAATTENMLYGQARDQSLNLLTKIQDQSTQSYLRGCWRGTYNLQTSCWGGGDCYEGGANSIYTGWTNAPISIAIAMVLLEEAMIPPKT